MDRLTLKSICRGFFAFNPTVYFYDYSNPAGAVKDAIMFNPKVAYYLESYRLFEGKDRCKIEAKYINTDTKPEDICIVKSVNEAVGYMCRYVGGFKKRFVIISEKTVNLEDAREEFYIKHSAFYSNLVNIHTECWLALDKYLVYEFTFKYRIGQVKLNMMESEVDAEVERIAKLLFTPDMPLEAKLYLAHNYLALNVVYKDNDKNSLDVSYTQSAYGALIKRECVCQGYAEAFKRIMDYAGIGCDIVCGQIVGSTEYHAWNIVDLGKEDSFCHIDVTWDNSSQKPEYTYFCKNDSFFEGKRIWDRELSEPCFGRFAVLSIARTYVYKNREILLARGIDAKVLDC